MINKLDKHRFAFTLAEVLITLGIIGVVAALTIPVLMNIYIKKQYAEGAKKGYSILTQAMKMAAVENDTPDDLRQVFADWTTAPVAIVKQLKTIKNCEWDYSQACFKSTDMGDDLGSAYIFITPDGMSYAIGFYANCAVDVSINDDSPTKNVCAMAWIDSNGPSKGPHQVGRDITRWYITSNPKKGVILYPTGGFDDNRWGSAPPQAVGEVYWNKGGQNECSGASINGWYCSGRLMDKGWVMDY